MSESMYDILSTIVGQPSNDYESFVLYMVACCVSILFIYAALNIMRMIAHLSKGVSR